jgi:hypothetical protein
VLLLFGAAQALCLQAHLLQHGLLATTTGAAAGVGASATTGWFTSTLASSPPYTVPQTHKIRPINAERIFYLFLGYAIYD